VPGHKCKAPGQPQLNQIAMDDTGDGGPILEDEVLNYLETLESKANEEIIVSIHAMDGTDNSNCIRLRAFIRNQVMLQLLDSGSSNTFVSELTLSRLECVIQAIDPVSVKVANGQVIQCIKKAKGLGWWCSGRTFHADAFVLLVAAYDMILGMDWLEQFNPMLCAWDRKWVEFQYEGTTVRLQGETSSLAKDLQEVSCDQVYKWCKSNEIWAVAMLKDKDTDGTMKVQCVPHCVQVILDKYEEVFKVPNSLPPSREYDHVA
jgi:hypothetical protein